MGQTAQGRGRLQPRLGVGLGKQLPVQMAQLFAKFYDFFPPAHPLINLTAASGHLLQQPGVGPLGGGRFQVAFEPPGSGGPGRLSGLFRFRYLGCAFRHLGDFGRHGSGQLQRAARLHRLGRFGRDATGNSRRNQPGLRGYQWPFQRGGLDHRLRCSRHQPHRRRRRLAPGLRNRLSLCHFGFGACKNRLRWSVFRRRLACGLRLFPRGGLVRGGFVLGTEGRRRFWLGVFLPQWNGLGGFCFRGNPSQPLAVFFQRGAVPAFGSQKAQHEQGQQQHGAGPADGRLRRFHQRPPCGHRERSCHLFSRALRHKAAWSGIGVPGQVAPRGGVGSPDCKGDSDSCGS